MTTTNPLPDLLLTPLQQNLLFAALSSNKKADLIEDLGPTPTSINPVSAQPPQSLAGFQASPPVDFDYEFAHGDSSFDFSFDDSIQPTMNDDITVRSPSESLEADGLEKRSHPDDEEEEEEGGGKRRESEDKVSKRPGRKPLTTEPTTKRKAQNRAAQRAFRERKEKHLKDLEIKVEELEKASENANHENKILRDKVEKMTEELNNYKKQATSPSDGRVIQGASANSFGHSFISHINDVNFQFEFPKFGSLPGPPTAAANGSTIASAPAAAKRHESDRVSPLEKPTHIFSPGNPSTYSQVGLDTQAMEEPANLSASLFSPQVNSTSISTNGSRSSLDSHLGSLGGATSTSSPSASSNSNAGGPSSSCGTSPEPCTQSPMGFKPVDTLTTIGEEQAPLNSTDQALGHFGNVDFGDFNWLPQNNFQFEPQLFGGYREPQENILGNGTLDDAFFNDAFDIDFTTPYNLPATTSTQTKKIDLIAQIDAAKDSDVDMPMTCNKIWERLQKCAKVQSGDFDLDGLCSELQKKAKCSGTGPVVSEREFKSVIGKYLGKSEEEMLHCETVDMVIEGAKKAAIPT